MDDYSNKNAKVIGISMAVMSIAAIIALLSMQDKPEKKDK